MMKAQFNPQLVKQFFKHGYRDRGMLKWQGFYLSDHTAALNHEKAAEQTREHVQPRPQQTPLEISRLLDASLTYQRPISLQLNIRDENGLFAEDLNGIVTGYDDDQVYLSTLKQPFSMDTIRNIHAETF
ncbi:hypothetical protein IV38_GL000990 [Lactobacillus selangorensis]|uniref:DNA-directed RNA polymerase beta subunit n=1 Tax=Lactobacillus selangorensis TaxID=81857 RepID=A0A0R2FJE2_9LACO|nr:hypothetical protein [Lactobacillus selangorensis]KRN28785.1 hypothetical protein IV38_GL000990 [Lactobacillus selangorensis]KRN32805.1 hypothetical protein IV40_GL000863 [Lactobacillus selangorensis]